MNILVNETQKKFLLFESRSNEISEKLETCKSFAKEIIREVQKQYKLDLRFLLGWGSAIGGIMHPLNEFVAGEYPNLNNSDIFLIVVGVSAILYFNTKESVLDLVKIIRNKNLTNEFTNALSKGEELKKTFSKFIESLNVGFHQITNIVAYTFLIPILPMIYQMSIDVGFNSTNISVIVKRIIGSISVGLSGIVVREIVKKLVERFSSS